MVNLVSLTPKIFVFFGHGLLSKKPAHRSFAMELRCPITLFRWPTHPLIWSKCQKLYSRGVTSKVYFSALAPRLQARPHSNSLIWFLLVLPFHCIYCSSPVWTAHHSPTGISFQPSLYSDPNTATILKPPQHLSKIPLDRPQPELAYTHHWCHNLDDRHHHHKLATLQPLCHNTAVIAQPQ